MMKFIIIICLIMIGFGLKAQEAEHLSPPKTYWQSYGFQKQPDFAKIAYYKSDSLGYEPVMAEVISFNKEGFIIQKYMRIYGKYASETAHNYVYTNGVLDSINTVASSSNFNSKQKLHYGANGVLEKVTASGVYTNFTDTYQYGPNGMVRSIQRTYQNGSKKEAFFDHLKNTVTEKETSAKGTVTETIFVYDGDDVLASFQKDGKNKIWINDKQRRIDFTIEIKENDPLNYALNLRKMKQEDAKKFQQTIGDLSENPSAMILFDIPAESKNENGDWTKRLQIDKEFGVQRRMVFKEIKYSDGSQSGSTEFDLIFDQKVKHIK
ncbi:hypothetical protein [Paenimyroides aestuarii]|uniref:Uncharacterized protein n=1 Tax=Paenimyroides aestuarii TaxID=2968490 RepID=A0ABY5NT98_9FLAO|nr:hypothetical protein [Paenimyroides aestuarii]UUV21765.1 hypothetical protein NPX36_01555 [Paenimyroides aestuarii]